MEIKYFGKDNEGELALVVDLFDNDVNPIISGLTMTQIAGTTFYKTASIFLSIPSLAKGTYVVIIRETTGKSRGHFEFDWNGTNVVNKNEINDKLFSHGEKRQLRDAIGIDGDKSIATGGQLQKKSESPYNNSVDTNEIR